MSIAVLILGPRTGPPQLDRSKIPPEEMPAFLHAVELLASLARFDREFRNAVLLFDASFQENQELVRAVERGQLDFRTLDLATDTLSAWQAIAARDGALTIYHFGNTIEAVRKSLHACPTLDRLVDHARLKHASAEFRKEFPRYEAIRHVVGHAADFAASPKKKDTHSVKGPWKADFEEVSIEVGDADATTQFSGALYQKSYCVTFEGQMHCYEISHLTADKIESAKERAYSAFLAALAPPK